MEPLSCPKRTATVGACQSFWSSNLHTGRDCLLGIPGCCTDADEPARMQACKRIDPNLPILLGPCPAEYLVAACSGSLCPPKGLASCGRASLLGACSQPPCHSGCKPAAGLSCCSTAAILEAPGTWAHILAGLPPNSECPDPDQVASGLRRDGFTAPVICHQ